MDHESFQACELDALYGELDAETSARMSAHAASCASCNARLERLRTTRERTLMMIEEPVPENFEARILAAVDAALATPTAPREAPAPRGARILQLFARPSFAVAAAFLLLLGAATFLMQTSASKSVASRSMDESTTIAPAPMPPAAPPAEPAVVAAATPAPTPSDAAKAKAAFGESEDPAFAAAKKLYDAGRYSEALPRFER